MASVDLQEKANFIRLSRLLVDKGTEALRNTFDAIRPPANLKAVLAAKTASLADLKNKRRVISNPQWDLLFPPSGSPPDSKTFDVTLLTVLFRNVCGFTAPSTGWDAMPSKTDRSIEANIVRLKSFRNKVYAHVTSTQVDDATFKSLWQEISQALVDLNIPQNDIDALETSPLGPEEVEIRKEYLDILKEWKSHLEENCSKKSDEDLLRTIAKHNFKGKIRSKVNFFHPGTREWLLQQVDEFVEKEQKSRMLLLTAGPGFGKSVFAAKVCEEFKKKGKLAASHFCDFSNSNLRDPMTMLQSLASQMSENITGFKEKLLDQLRRPHKDQSLKDVFTIYLQNPLGELDLEEPSLVVIDGLDESAADDKNKIMNLIDEYFQHLPECIKFLVTSRPEISVANLRDVQKINIDSNDAKNNADLELYLKACLPSLADRKAEIPSFSSVCEELAEKCEGSFLYAFYVQSELRKRDSLHKMTFNEIMEFVPQSLDSRYLKYFNRLEDELRAIMDGSLDVFRILEMLAVSETPLPLSFISRALGLAPDCRETRKIIDQVNETVSCLLYVFDDLVTVFHKSVTDWLLAEGYKDHEYTVKVMDGNKSLWLICEKVFEEIKETVCSGHHLNVTNDVKYALGHGFYYLQAWSMEEACSMEESLFWSVDVVIIYILLIDGSDDIGDLLNFWGKIVQLGPLVISNKLRERISWHFVEVGFLQTVDELTSKMVHDYYLQSVLTHSPEGYFSDSEKKIAESLLQKVPRFAEYDSDDYCLKFVLPHSPEGYFSDNEKEIAESLLRKVPRFVEYNFNEVEVLPLAAWCDFNGIEAVGLSHDKTMAAVVDNDDTIRVVSVPSLVELWQYSTQSKRIQCCTFAPDSSFVLFGNLETVLSIAKRKEVPFFHGYEETFTSCAFSPNGKRMVTSCDGSNTIKLWDVSGQRLLESLCADVPVDWCSFSSTGLFIIGMSKYFIDVSSEDSDSHYEIQYGRFDQEDSFCVWNAITWKRSDERNIRDAKPKEPGVFQDKKCKRCFSPRFKELNSSNLEMNVCAPFTFSKDEMIAWSTGIYNGVECNFSSKCSTLRVIESTHFTTLAAWDLFVDIPVEGDYINCYKLTTIGDNLWFYADKDKLFVFRTSAPLHQQSSRPTRVLSSSFSPDGSRLATCTSDGYINIWNVNTGQVGQRFKSNQGDSSFACWWSEKFLFVFDFFDRIPSLSKYPVDVNLGILFPRSQQVSLSHLLEEFVSLTAIVDFSEGLLSFECGKSKPVKILEVSGVGGPRMVNLPGIQPGMSITVSPGASFVFAFDEYMYDDEYMCYIWERNAKEELGVYKKFFAKQLQTTHLCCFSNDSEVAVVLDVSANGAKIFDLVTGDHKSVDFEENSDADDLPTKLFCLNKDRVLIAAHQRRLDFFHMDSSAFLSFSFQRYLTRDSLKQLKLSPKESMMAFPKINGDMEFLRLCIPQHPALLSSMKL